MAASILNVGGGDIHTADHTGCNNNNNNYHHVLNSNKSVENNNNDNSTSNAISQNLYEMKEKRMILEQRKQHLEKLLLEKKAILQQIQQEEANILQGNHDNIHYNDIFNHLSQQFKLTQQQQQQENLQTSVADFKISTKNTNTAILRRKSSTSLMKNDNQVKQQQQQQHINFKIRLPEISNRSSEYDNYPCDRILDCEDETAVKLATTLPTSPITVTSFNKKRPTPTPSHFENTPAGILDYASSPRQIPRQTVDRHRFHQECMKHTALPLQQQRQQITSNSADTISLYSINSSNVATLRHQHIAPQQQPIIVQYEKYCLSPTRQIYNDGSFIKSSQDIKRFIPSPLQQQQYQQQHHQQALPRKSQSTAQLLGYQQSPIFVQCQPWDSISLAPSYLSDNNSNVVLGIDSVHNSDVNDITASNCKISLGDNKSNKQSDDISVCSTNSENQKRGLKPKVWLESSLDGPLVRATNSSDFLEIGGAANCKLSSHSMSTTTSSSRHNSMSATLKIGSSLGIVDVKSFPDNSSSKLRLTQSSSYLNELETIHTKAMPKYKYESVHKQTLEQYNNNNLSNQNLQQKNSKSITPPPPPRSFHCIDKSLRPASITPPPPPDIRIESPKNMTVITQATFQPYKEVTKPFEMSDFYKYSTKFRQKDNLLDGTSIL